jgi:hypothetical protein
MSRRVVQLTAGESGAEAGEEPRGSPVPRCGTKATTRSQARAQLGSAKAGSARPARTVNMPGREGSRSLSARSSDTGHQFSTQRTAFDPEEYHRRLTESLAHTQSVIKGTIDQAGQNFTRITEHADHQLLYGAMIVESWDRILQPIGEALKSGQLTLDIMGEQQGQRADSNLSALHASLLNDLHYLDRLGHDIMAINLSHSFFTETQNFSTAYWQSALSSIIFPLTASQAPAALMAQQESAGQVSGLMKNLSDMREQALRDQDHLTRMDRAMAQLKRDQAAQQAELQAEIAQQAAVIAQLEKDLRAERWDRRGDASRDEPGDHKRFKLSVCSPVDYRGSHYPPHV